MTNQGPGTTLPEPPFIHGYARRGRMLACGCAFCLAGVKRTRALENGRRVGAGASGSCIVTLRRRADERKVTVTAYGDNVQEALRTVVEGLNARDFQLLAVSTPRSILNDLHAPPAFMRHPTGQASRPERTLLSKLGRLDLLAADDLDSVGGGA